MLDFKSGTSIVALNNSRADVVGPGLSEGRVRLASGFWAGVESGAGNSVPLLPFRCGGECCSGSALLSFPRGFAQLSQSTKALLPLHPFVMHLCFPLSHSPPGPALDLQFPRLNA